MDTADFPREGECDAKLTQSRMRFFRQGDIVSVKSIPVIGDDGAIETTKTPFGAVVISQTCDLVQADRLTVQLATIRELSPQIYKEVVAGKRPRFVALPMIEANLVADLEVIGTISKAQLASLGRKPGIPEGDDAGGWFGRAVGRRFSRFPFPDEIYSWIRPLQELLQSKAAKRASPIGKIMDSVTTLRLECVGGWRQTPPLELVLLIIVKPGVLPTLADPLTPIPDQLSRWAYTEGALSRQPAEVAQKLVEAKTGPDLLHLWQMFGDSLAEKCYASGQSDDRYSDAVASIEAEVLAEDEFTFDRYRRSEELDLDHLSPPEPV
ncbi:hypothetical protein [Actinomadura hibisca]|uniref:hypothetical protein n=1 Tax=Actinomadura hibisca TaxID=68565 RepID=UPI000A866B0F|nr:hypothetical protein [Actinomadura hibisca]